MPELGSLGSVRGALSNERPYREIISSSPNILAVARRPSAAAHALAVRRALKLATIEFIDENGGGPGVRLRKCQWLKNPK